MALLACHPAARERAPTVDTRDRATCATCHADIAREWSASPHGRSAEGAFERAFSEEPLAACTGCHDPPARPPEATAHGVSCTQCHRAPHQEPAAKADERCAGCHEFSFPGAPFDAMQSTLTEHAASGLAREPCGVCHTPVGPAPGAAHTTHAWRGSEDAAFVRGAVDVEASRSPAGLRLVFRRRALGHAFPTGDAFRRLRVRARVSGPDHLVFEEKQLFLERHSSVVAVGLTTRRIPTGDDRPLQHADETTVEIPLSSEGGTLTWQVTYERVLLPAERDEDAVLDGSIEVAEGRIDP